MNQVIVESSDGVTLVAGGPVLARDLAFARRRAPCFVAADGGAEPLLAAGLQPQAVIGDMDSLSPAAGAALDPARIHPIAEQDSTDFDKALRNIRAPFILALGCLGGRVDHELAVLNTLVRYPDQACVLIGAKDVIFHARSDMRLRLAVGDRLSLFPMASVTGRSTGLRWAIDGLNFTPSGQIGTSNEVSASDVNLQFDGPGMLVILPRNRLNAVLAMLV